MACHPCSSIYIKEWGTKTLIRRFGIVYSTPTTWWSEGKQHFFFPLGGLQCIRIYNHSVPSMKTVSLSLLGCLSGSLNSETKGKRTVWVPWFTPQALFHPCLVPCHPPTIILPCFPKSWAILFQREKVLVTCTLNIQSFVENGWQGLLAPYATSILSALPLPLFSALPEASTFWDFWDLVGWIDSLTPVF